MPTIVFASPKGSAMRSDRAPTIVRPPIAVRVLDRMLELGRPKSVRIA